MASCDVFDLMIHDDFLQTGHQRNVMMRGVLASIPVVEGPSHRSICEVRIIPGEVSRVLTELVVSRYSGSRHWATYGPRVLDLIDDIRSDRLWQLNLALLLGVREILDIRTPISFARPGDPRSNVGPSRVRRGRADSDTLGEIERRGPQAGDSILTVLMDRDDPMATVMAEHASAAVSV